MNEERKLILEMVKEGTVTVDEAERLLSALAAEIPAQAEELAVADNTPGNWNTSKAIRPKRLIVNVTSDGKSQVNVRLPFSLVRAGLKIGKSVTGMGSAKNPQMAQANEILQGVDIDELLDSISDGDITLPYTIVDVDDSEQNESVRVVIE